MVLYGSKIGTMKKVSNQWIFTDKGVSNEFEPIEIYRRNIDKVFPVR